MDALELFKKELRELMEKHNANFSLDITVDYGGLNSSYLNVDIRDGNGMYIANDERLHDFDASNREISASDIK